MPNIAPLVQALQLHDWYAFAALCLTLIVYFCRNAPVLRDLWKRIPDGFRGYAVLLVGAATAFICAFDAHLPLSTALLAAVGGALGISIPSMGLNAALTDSHLPWNGGAGGSSGSSSKDASPPEETSPPTERNAYCRAWVRVHRGFMPRVSALFACLVLIGCSGARTRPVLAELVPLACQAATERASLSERDSALVCSDADTLLRIGEDIVDVVRAARSKRALPAGDGGAGGSQ